MTKTIKDAKTRLEALKAETLAAIDSGKFASCPADAEGITPQTRLEWVAPSIDYIKGVAAGLPEKDIEAALSKLKMSDENELMFSYIAIVETITKDQYVSEGKYNLSKALEIMDDETATADDESDENPADDEAKSLWDKAKSKLFCKKPKTSPKKNDGKTELCELKARIAKLEAEKADSDKRAATAEAEVKALKAKLKAMGINT